MADHVHRNAQRDRLTAQIAARLSEWSLAPVVAALQTMRDMALVNASKAVRCCR